MPDEKWFRNRIEAKVETWRRQYNGVRPHFSLTPPYAFGLPCSLVAAYSKSFSKYSVV